MTEAAPTAADAPANLEAEESALGAMMLSRPAVDVVAEILAPADFYRESHGTIFAAILAVARRDEPTEPLMVVRELERLGRLDGIGGAGRVREIVALTPVASNARHYALLVLEASRNRALLRAGQRAAEAASNGGVALHPELVEDLRRALAAAEEGALEPERALPPIVSARDLCAEPDPPDDDVVLGPLLIRGQRTIVGARGSGQGKTTFCLAMVAALANRTHFLGFSGSGGRALVIDLEQGRRTIKRRLREANLAGSLDVDLWVVPEGLSLESDRRQRLVIERALSSSWYDVVMLDPHYKAHSGDANEERDARALFSHLDRWRAEHGFALILPTHGRKLPAGSAWAPPTEADVAAGSGAITRGAEIILGLERRKPGVASLYFFKHRDGADSIPVGGDPWTLSFSRERGYVVVDVSTGPRKAPAEEIADWVRRHGGRASPGDLRVEFDISDQALRDRRPALAALGIEYRSEGRSSVYVAAEELLVADEPPPPEETAAPPGAYDEPDADPWEEEPS